MGELLEPTVGNRSILGCGLSQPGVGSYPHQTAAVSQEVENCGEVY